MYPELIPVWVIALAITLSSCGTEQTELQRKILASESKVEILDNQLSAESLLQDYLSYVDRYPGDHELNGRYLYRAAGLSVRMNRYSKAVELLHQALRDHYASSNTFNNAMLLGSLYADKLGNPDLARVVFKAIAQAFPDKGEDVRLAAEQGAPLNEELLDLESGVFSEDSAQVNFRQANDFINAATLYAMLIPSAEDASHWLFQAAETARSLRVYSMAMGLYDWLSRSWPHSQEAPQALFLKAFVLDNDLNRREEAKGAYEAFLRLFPSDGQSEDAKNMLQRLGRDEEMRVKDSLAN